MTDIRKKIVIEELEKNVLRFVFGTTKMEKNKKISFHVDRDIKTILLSFYLNISCFMTLIFTYLKGILNIIMAYSFDIMIARDIYSKKKCMEILY